MQLHLRFTLLVISLIIFTYVAAEISSVNDETLTQEESLHQYVNRKIPDYMMELIQRLKLSKGEKAVFGRFPKNALLLYGSSEIDRKVIAQYIAIEAECPYIFINHQAEFPSHELMQGALQKSMNEAVKYAEEAERICIVIIDKMDEIELFPHPIYCCVEPTDQEWRGENLLRLFNQYHVDKRIFFICTANCRPDMLSPRIFRLFRHLEVERTDFCF